MNFGPRDFFIGIVHLFVIFLPGAVVLLTIMYVASDLQNLGGDLNIGGIGAALLFVGVSYFVGHLVSLAASAIENKEISLWPRKGEFGLHEAVMRRKAHDICVRILGRAGTPPKKIRRWSALLVKQESSALQEGVESKDADRRFFRNIRLVLLFLFLAAVWKILETGLNDKAYYFVALMLALLTVLAHFRFVNQDEKYTELVFESLIAINACKPDVQTEAVSAVTHAGGIVFRRKGNNIEYLLVRSKNNDTEWVLPKGHVGAEETVEEAAVREVKEETGEVVEIRAFLDFTNFSAGKEQIRLANFLMKPAGESRGSQEGRGSEWYVYEKACKELSFPESLSVLDQANKLARRC